MSLRRLQMNPQHMHTVVISQRSVREAAIIPCKRERRLESNRALPQSLQCSSRDLRGDFSERCCLLSRFEKRLGPDQTLLVTRLILPQSCPEPQQS